MPLRADVSTAGGRLPGMPKYETTHNKRAGIFYGAASGHPIIWNNDWNSLIQKEVLARDQFSRKFMAGSIHAPVPVYADISMNDTNWNSQLKSTYMDLGKWGPATFRHSVPHVVKKGEAEAPSIPQTGRSSEAMSEYAFRHARQQLGKPMTKEYKTRKQRMAESLAVGGEPVAAAVAGAETDAGGHAGKGRAGVPSARRDGGARAHTQRGGGGGEGGAAQERASAAGGAIPLEKLRSSQSDKNKLKVRVHTNTNTHTNTQTNTHTQTHTHTHTHMHARAHARTHAHARAHARAHTHTRTYTHTHTHR